MAGCSFDPLTLSRDLIRCPSVTPEEGGALGVLERALEPLGLACERMPFSGPGNTPRVDNLYARIGFSGRNFCFAGHTDVVPAGDRDAWSVDPFEAVVRDGFLIGRGAADMKCAVACMVAATERFLKKRGRNFHGSISFLITGDEEGPAVNGTVKMLDVLATRGEKLDACLVGEPTNPETLGEMVKIGRRGSLNGRLLVSGGQGHVAYPEKADNPAPKLLKLLAALDALTLDEGTDHFQPGNLEITDIHIGNPATNVIPNAAAARFNVRFNDRYSGESLETKLRAALDAVGHRYELDCQVSGESFLTPPGELSELISRSVAMATGRKPELSTSGGTSDARFIRKYCAVAEFGLVNATAHKVDERIAVDDLEPLSAIYEGVLDGYFVE